MNEIVEFLDSNLRLSSTPRNIHATRDPTELWLSYHSSTSVKVVHVMLLKWFQAIPDPGLQHTSLDQLGGPGEDISQSTYA